MEIKIIRKIDELGRVVIPIDVRKHLGLETADSGYIRVGNRVLFDSASNQRLTKDEKDGLDLISQKEK
jgi:bifunctional DNA-binding transcriptional regulator/antitoxin component of YhaV-PrlF toxin-antitoxin module